MNRPALALAAFVGQMDKGKLPANHDVAKASRAALISISRKASRPMWKEQEQVIKDICQKLDTNAFTTVGAHRKEVWEQGWMENLQEFAQKGYALEKLVPRFVRPNPIVRLNQQFVRAHDPHRSDRDRSPRR